jgi:thiol-disulfide isomerase/thioredoxin
MSMPGRRQRRWALPRKPVAASILMLATLTVVTACGSGSTSTTGQGKDDSGYVGSEHQLTSIAPKKRRPAPKIVGESLTGSKKINTGDYSGEVLVINVWGSWCAPCRREAPDLRTASKKTAGTARFIGIDSRDSGKAAPRAFVRRFKIDYPSIYDPDGSQVVKFTKVPPSAIPSTLVIDPHGRVAARVLGRVTSDTLVGLVHDVAGGH